MKTLKELLIQTTWQQVFESLQKYYSEDIENNCEAYQYAFEEICEIEPEINNDDMVLKIRYIKSIYEDNTGYYDVSGFVDNEYYGLDFTPWSEWLGFYIDEELFKQFSCADIIAHTIWEMTYHGFSKEKIQNKKDELIKRVEEIKDDESKWINTKELGWN